MREEEANLKLALATNPPEPVRPRKIYTPEPTRLLPQAPDAEKGVLSSFLIAPAEIGGLCAEQNVDSEWFAIPSHALIYRRLVDMWDSHAPIDFITLTAYLRERGELDQCGGAAFVTELFTFLPTAANCPYYLDKLKEFAALRRMINVCTEYAGRGYEEHSDVEALIDRCEAAVMKIRGSAAIDKLMSAKEAVVLAIQQIDSMYDRKGSISGLATGYCEIDRLTDGLHPAEMIVIAARPSQGKTALAMNIAEFIAVELKKPVGVFSLEMSTPQIFQRMLCSRARVNLARVRDGYLSERDFPALQQAAAKIATAPIYIDDQSGMTIQQLRAKARRMKAKYGIEILFVDYLQLLRSTSKRAENNREQEVADVSAGLKDLAKELGIPVVVLAQIKRGFDERAMKGRPRLSDLRESGAIEADADVVGFLVRYETFAENEEEREANEGKADLIIAKQRSGPIGDVPLTFLKEYTRFETRAHGYEDEGPPLVGDSGQSFPI